MVAVGKMGRRDGGGSTVFSEAPGFNTSTYLLRAPAQHINFNSVSLVTSVKDNFC